MGYPERKVKILNNFLELFSKFKQIILVDLINISTKQIVNTRIALRKTGSVILVGKNNLANLAIKILTNEDKNSEYYPLQQKYGKNSDLLKLTPFIVGKIGFVFSQLSYIDLKDIIESERIKTSAKQGMIAPSSIILPAGPTNLDPGRIIEFQRLGIQTKINKNVIEITKDFNLCKQGDIVSATVCFMCNILNIVPFEFSMVLSLVYLEGIIIPKDIIQIDVKEMISVIAQNVKEVTAISIEAGLTNSLSLPHVMRNTFKSLLAVGIESGLKLKELDQLMSASSNVKTITSNVNEKTEKVEIKEEIKEEEVDMDMGDLFG